MCAAADGLGAKERGGKILVKTRSRLGGEGILTTGRGRVRGGKRRGQKDEMESERDVDWIDGQMD